MPTGSNRYRFDSENHIHLCDGRPLIGTSSVSSVVAKPLTYWASGMAVKQFGCENPKMLTKIKNGKASQAEKQAHFAALQTFYEGPLKSMGVQGYCALVDRAYRAHATDLKKTSQTGIDLHFELARFGIDRLNPNLSTSIKMYQERIWSFCEWADKNVKKWLWVEGHCYSERYWLGGICDLGVETDDGVGIVDFKSSKDAYLPQLWQCAGYSLQIEENGIVDTEGNQIMEPRKADWVGVVPFGAENVEIKINVDVPGCQTAFLAELEIYKRLPRE